MMGTPATFQVLYGEESQMSRVRLRNGSTSAESAVMRNTEISCIPRPISPENWEVSHNSKTTRPMIDTTGQPT